MIQEVGKVVTLLVRQRATAGRREVVLPLQVVMDTQRGRRKVGVIRSTIRSQNLTTLSRNGECFSLAAYSVPNGAVVKFHGGYATCSGRPLACPNKNHKPASVHTNCKVELILIFPQNSLFMRRLGV